MSGKNKLQSSKPCVNCIKVMHNLPKQLGYSVKHIYYSDNNGGISFLLRFKGNNLRMASCSA